MYSKKLRGYFKKYVINQSLFAARFGHVQECIWICLGYLAGLEHGMAAIGNYDNIVNPFFTESFEYIFRSLVEYRRG